MKEMWEVAWGEYLDTQTLNFTMAPVKTFKAGWEACCAKHGILLEQTAEMSTEQANESLREKVSHDKENPRL